MSNPGAIEYQSGSEIAVIGMAGRFPGARNVDEFWKNLREGVESITFFSDEQLLSSGVDPAFLNKGNYVKARSILEDIEMFDAAFFGFSPSEAAIMDPQHRLFMECVWEAIENAGYDPERFNGAISVYAGSGGSSYLINNVYANPEVMESMGTFQISISNSDDALATRIAYKLNLKGACYSIQTFCSTSLVAVHVACQSLLNFECDMAAAGGVSIRVPQASGYLYEEGTILSPDGHCRPFSDRAQGTVFGNGSGVVVLKRLEDALDGGDHIEAVILGSATNNDGSLKVSYTAPSVEGQAEVIAEAMANAETPPESISYVETHGTATALGDPTELTALTRAFRSETQAKGFCAIGSVKSNIGHIDRASGVASLIKTVLSLKHKQIPPSLHCESPNPDIDFENSPFFVNTQLSEWKPNGIPRRAGVSSFGVGGTNAHVIVQEAPDAEASRILKPCQLFVLSARTNSALNTMTTNLAEHMRRHPNLEIAEVAYTLQIGRKAFNHRRMIVCQNFAEALAKLDAGDPKSMPTVYQERRNPPVVFMFSGQGSQYVNMGLELYKTEAEFKKHFDRCSEILKPQLDIDLREILYPVEENTKEASNKLKNTIITQPALFSIEYALARLWMSWGIQPESMVGHSIGEYVAACLAGVFSLEDALLLVATRGNLMQELPGGSMMAVALSEEKLGPLLGEELSLAAVNGPSLCVASGEAETIDKLEAMLAERGINGRHLHTSHAFHSKMMNPILEEFTMYVSQVRRQPPQIPFLSNVTGTWITPDEAVDPGYWARHLRQTVRFSDCVRELLKEPGRVLLEIGPGQTLNTLARQHSNRSKDQIVLFSLRHPQEQRSDCAIILDTLGKLWLAGIEVDWPGVHNGEKLHRVPLPTYPFERQRYWVEPVKQQQGYPAFQAELCENADNPKQTLETEAKVDFPPPGDKDINTNYIEPKNKVEQTLADIWQKVLGVEYIGADDNFFDLGGSSLMAVQLFNRIEKEFGKRLPLATLYETPTVEQLADIIVNEEWEIPWSSLVEIKSGGSNPPLFLVHGAGGNVLNYRDLSLHLGPDQPVYGIQSHGLNGRQPLQTSIEEMASHYVREIQTVQPKGPYFLGGYCMGGTVAFEMAQLLLKQGQEVAFLALMETYNWANLTEKSFLNRIFYNIQKIDFHWRNVLISNNKLAFLKEKIYEVWRRKKVWLGMIKSKIGDKYFESDDQGLILSQIWDVNDRAAINYMPKPYSGEITLFLPIKEYAYLDRPELRWDELTLEEVDLYRLPVYPAGMLIEPFVELLAEKFRDSIEKAINIG